MALRRRAAGKRDGVMPGEVVPYVICVERNPTTAIQPGASVGAATPQDAPQGASVGGPASGVSVGAMSVSASASMGGVGGAMGGSGHSVGAATPGPVIPASPMLAGTPGTTTGKFTHRYTHAHTYTAKQTAAVRYAFARQPHLVVLAYGKQG